MAKKASKKVDDVNNKIVEELLSKGDPSQLFGKDGLFMSSDNYNYRSPTTIITEF